MHEEPRKRSFFTPAAYEAPITLSAMARLSDRKSTGYLSLKAMPPTLAAATMTASGLVVFGLAGEIKLRAIDCENSARLRSEATRECSAHHPPHVQRRRHAPV